MTDDIVERLREEGFITHMGQLPRESKLLHAAADEIERLRKELGQVNDADSWVSQTDAAHLDSLLTWCEFNAMDWHRALARLVNDCARLRGEVNRLRAGGCARDQRTTQFCAEAVTLQREAEQLRDALRIEQEELAACCIDRKETQRERDEARRERDGFLDGNKMMLKALNEANEIARKYKAERDEARRLYINEMCLREYGDTSARIREANARGWDCFNSERGSDPGDECQREAL